MAKTLSNGSDEATERTNVPEQMTPILTIQPDDGLLLKILNDINKGEGSGIPISALLKDANGNDLPLDTEFALEFERPSDTKPSIVSEVQDNIETYRLLNLTEQRKEEYIDGTKIELASGAQELVWNHRQKVHISIKCTEKIDWSNSRLSFNENAVRELNGGD